MMYIFSWSTSHAFKLFSTPHLFTLCILMLVLITMGIFKNRLRHPVTSFVVRICIALVLVLTEYSFHLWFIYHQKWDVTTTLPLQLSSISLFLAVFLLLTRRFFLFEITYFVGSASALLAMITPDLGVYGYPHFRFFHFFIAHGGIIVAAFYMIMVEKYKPTYLSIWKTFLSLNLFVILIFMLNLFLDANYMYLMAKPLSNTLLTYLGPWPIYLLSLEGIAILAFHLLYLPFIFTKWTNTSNDHSGTTQFNS
ncbi:TIGR02206 family membrane protein [Guptibacillus hwajinpoensis]|uniref:YwaF family protein n=1 Tax=Guptibacillus hwajinpoensis TaxID=208199 RepID=UPI0037366543